MTAPITPADRENLDTLRREAEFRIEGNLPLSRPMYLRIEPERVLAGVVVAANLEARVVELEAALTAAEERIKELENRP